MIVKWLGHSCFLINSEEGLSILLDPFYEDSVGYSLPKLEADIVLISHSHTDHSNAAAGGREAEVISGPGLHSVNGLAIRGIKSYHDRKKGKLRGENTIFCFELDGIRVCHLGDLGHILSQEQISEIGPVDLLFLPVGGRYTIDARAAGEVMAQLRPALAVPMHYRTRALSFELGSVNDFLQGRKDAARQEQLELKAGELTGQGRIVILSCAAAEGVADR